MAASVERRAAVHSALGEPIRLVIVDLLCRGDASPGELAEAVGLGSNLLAHHLKVLEAAQVIRRVRSEGDRRRSYVQLQFDDPTVTELANAGAGGCAGRGLGDVPRILFVCTANSARSQLAAARWNAVSPIPAASAGTHPARRLHPRAVAAGRRHGLRLGRAKPAAVTEVRQDGDLVIAVCDNAYEELESVQPRLHWSVPDPARVDTEEAFEAAYNDIARRVERLAGSLTEAEQRPERAAELRPLEGSSWPPHRRGAR